MGHQACRERSTRPPVTVNSSFSLPSWPSSGLVGRFLRRLLAARPIELCPAIPWAPMVQLPHSIVEVLHHDVLGRTRNGKVDRQVDVGGKAGTRPKCLHKGLLPSLTPVSFVFETHGRVRSNVGQIHIVAAIENNKQISHCSIVGNQDRDCDMAAPVMRYGDGISIPFSVGG